MNNWFALLVFKRISDLTGYLHTELDTYADYTFPNGIWIRVVTGKMAKSYSLRPYEMIIKEPHCKPYSIGNMNKHLITLKMENLSTKKVIE